MLKIPVEIGQQLILLRMDGFKHRECGIVSQKGRSIAEQSICIIHKEQFQNQTVN